MDAPDPTADYRGKVYVGRSRKGDDGFSLERAVEDAYEQATKDDKSGPFRVIEIWVDGTNPLSEYRVALGSS